MEIYSQLLGNMLVIGGAALFAGLVFQVLMGKRVIRLKGKAHMKVHRLLGYLLLVGAAAHGSLAIITRVG